MSKALIVSSIFLALLYSSCKNGKSRKPVIRDTSITTVTSFNNLFMDSTRLSAFLSNHRQYQNFTQQFNDFYKDRNYAYAWFDSAGLAEQALNFNNLQQNYIASFSDSSIYNPVLDSLLKGMQTTAPKKKIADSQILETELLLTGQFFQYAAKVYKGSDIDAAELGWFIPRKKIDVHALLDSTILHKSAEAYAPQNSQYKRLQQFVQTYSRLSKETSFDSIPTLKKSLRKGDSSEIILPIKKHLELLGDLTQNDGSPFFDTALVLATKQYQQRMGLTVDGVIGNKMIAELNVPMKQRLRQILINLERLRWMPPEKDTNYILVNIPEFMMHVYDSGRLQFNINVIVGTSANSTVIFNDRLQYIVFSPYWNVPESIVRGEILPGIKKNPNYLAKHNMEIVKQASVPVIRQMPGPANSLGLVKFLFPNNYSIYFHDTPNRNLFSQSSRSFSHGCIRVGEPKKLAQYLLRSDSNWTTQKIDSAMHLKKEKWVPLKKSIPVFIVYFTAWVNQEGQLNFRKDIYKHDEKMAMKLFSQESGSLMSESPEEGH
ncbi:L,D-transpeptidase family protein [Sediminibacterium sp.]|uniref:L,D-transpeptidase family protein n=1 Tax=Sediminibacterium sp. TaxID=1917865 RepID=UPI0025FD385A|nr:L,D-transpeptidase family protein [Sediminibacterium sp.]MBW0178831.1 L,D-transpeptidase family protein [Sediminibacterium sp.]